MFKMRIINLVNISTVLLLINLLQTKSQGHSTQRVTVLAVSVDDAQLSDKMTSVPVPWTADYKDPETSDFKKLAAESCNLFREYVKTVIPKGSDEGLCTSPIFEPPGLEEDGVSISLKLSFIYVDVTQPDTTGLETKLVSDYETFRSDSSYKITEVDFNPCETQIDIPRENSQTEDKDAIDGSKWKIIAIIALVALAIVVIGGCIYIFVK
uniref:SJCHGC01915 protein n=1 Tax=Schistosoma japonicum TaxID=6182 RepID=Q5DFB9_SCHJA|nr:SJCHGC01915 protein [Schistosoma japonicum]